MKRTGSYFIVLTFLMIFSLSLNGPSFADDQELFTQGSSYKPNVLIIMDNSQSMDEDFMGNAVAPYASESKLVAAKKQLQAIVTNYDSKMRFGLMTYKLPSVASSDVYNSPYFVSHQKQSYCPTADETVLAGCQAYCIDPTNTTAKGVCEDTPVTGCKALNSDFDAAYFPDEIITGSTGTKRAKYCNLIYPKTNRMINPTNTSLYVYYKQALPYYDSAASATHFRYAHTYGIGESTGKGVPVPGVVYTRYYVKNTDADDGTGYSGSFGTLSTGPSDSDLALGYLNFGKRRIVTNVGKTWFANTSPGGGYLHVEAGASTQLAALTAKLTTHEDDQATYMNTKSSTTCGDIKSNTCSFVINAGLTPIEGTLQNAIDYFKGALVQDTKTISSPIQDYCQKNFVIFVTDGLPSVNASGQSGSAEALMPAVKDKIDRLRALTKSMTVGNVTEDYTFNILTYVIGVGLTQAARTQLDEMASHGGTSTSDGHALYADNETAIYDALDTIMKDIDKRSFAFATSSISSSRTADENFIYEATFVPAGNDYPLWKGALKKWSLKADSSLNAVVWNAGDILQEKDADKRNMKTLIGGSIVNFDKNNDDGTNVVPFAYLNVADSDAANKIFKYVRGYPTDAATSYINPETDSDGIKTWKLGDIFHSSPITLGTPTPFFVDSKETNPYTPPANSTSSPSDKAYDTYRKAHPRASYCSGGATDHTCDGYGKRMVIVGANDGQYHAFNAATGQEFWSFVPPNLLPKLKYFAHESDSSTSGHHFFVDGPTTATDAWLPSDSDLNDGTRKKYTDWKTLVMFSLGRKERPGFPEADKATKYWSSSASCDTGITDTYHATNAPYYCGYYAFDFTPAPDSDPLPLWRLKPDANGVAAGPYLGDPWSAVSTGRVKIDGKERWIGVIGGGYNTSTCGASTCDDANKRGKGIVVFDLRNGEALWSYHWGPAISKTTSPDLAYAIPSQVALIDGDYDGYLDHGYFGDMNGDMWQIQFCTKDDLANPTTTCGTSTWKGSLLLTKNSTKAPIYMPPTVVRDRNSDIWLYWGAGDYANPTGNGPADFFYGLKPLTLLDSDNDGIPGPGDRSKVLANLTSAQNNYCGSKNTKAGWYYNFAGQGEQVLAQPVAFDNVLYFTSFKPARASSVTCTKTGSSQLYAIGIDPGINEATCTAGTGMFSGGDRYIDVGAGIASKVQLSFGPDGTIKAFVTVSGAGGQEGGTILAPFNPSTIQKRAYMLYWKDKRANEKK